MTLDQPSRRAFLAGSVVALGGGSAYYLGRSDEGGAEDEGEARDLSPSVHVSNETSPIGVGLDGKPILGSPDAPIEIYYWTDFQCPFCAQFERDTLPDLVSDHVDPGRVRIVFVAIPYFGADSMTAAVASKCVWEQVRESDPSAYWDWHEAIFAEQGEKNSGWAAAGNLVEYTRPVDGVDADALATCLDERRSEFEARVDEDAAHARSLGVTGTPTFVVFDRDAETAGKIVGAQPFGRFDETIERVRNASSGDGNETASDENETAGDENASSG